MTSPYLEPGATFTKANGEPFTPAEHEDALRLAVMQTMAAMACEQIETTGTFDPDARPSLSEIRARIIARAFPNKSSCEEEPSL